MNADDPQDKEEQNQFLQFFGDLVSSEDGKISP